MKALWFYKPTRQAIRTISQITDQNNDNEVTIHHFGGKYSAQGSITQSDDNSLAGRVNIFANYDPFSAKCAYSPATALYLSAKHQSFNKRLAIIVSATTNSFSHIRPVEPLQSSLVSIKGKLKYDPLVGIVGVGLNHDGSIETSSSIETQMFSLSLRSTISDSSTKLCATVLTSIGPFIQVSGDIATAHFTALKFGWIRSLPKNSAAYAQCDLISSKACIGLSREIASGVSIGSVASYKLQAQELDGAVAIDVKRAAHFYGKINYDGDMIMAADFSPREWLKVTLRSRTSIASKFQPVYFGWSLAFDV